MAFGILGQDRRHIRLKSLLELELEHLFNGARDLPIAR
jgi:hypothetical protein